jgi:predicted enzyme related to lactoylglutathione lyase
MAHGAFYWNELLTDDVEKAKSFFAATIGWTFEGMHMLGGGTYWVAHADGKGVAGIMSMLGIAPPGVPPHWIGYLEVDDIEKRIAGVEAHGGRVLRSPFDVPGIGRIAIVTDATGAAMGWITPVPAG